MANSIWQGTVQNATGDIVPGAEITVVDEDTGLPATIFSSIGGAALANPFFANSEGFAQFYAAAGTYRVTAEDTGTGQTVVFRYNRFGDAASRDIGTSSGQIPDADDLDMVGNTNWSSGNLQSGLYDGIGVRMKMKNKSGAAIGNGALIAGSQLISYFIDATGVSQESLIPSGTWQNVSGSGVGNGNGVEFLRIA